MDSLLAGNLIPPFQEGSLAGSLSSAARPSGCGNHSGIKPINESGIGQSVIGFPPESVIAFNPER
jgi:hypothetical protein